jgi:WD40 repeat protein
MAKQDCPYIPLFHDSEKHQKLEAFAVQKGPGVASSADDSSRPTSPMSTTGGVFGMGFAGVGAGAMGSLISLTVTDERIIAVYSGSMSVQTFRWSPIPSPTGVPFTAKAEKQKAKHMIIPSSQLHRSKYSDPAALKMCYASGPTAPAKEPAFQAANTISSVLKLTGVLKRSTPSKATTSNRDGKGAAGAGLAIDDGFDGSCCSLLCPSSSAGSESDALLLTCGYWDGQLKCCTVNSSAGLRALASEVGLHRSMKWGAVNITSVAVGEDQATVLTGSDDCTCTVWIVRDQAAAAAAAAAKAGAAAAGAAGGGDGGSGAAGGGAAGGGEDARSLNWINSSAEYNGGGAGGGGRLELVHRLYGHSRPVVALAISTVLDVAVSCASDGSMHVYTVRKGGFVRSIEHLQHSKGVLLEQGRAKGILLKLAFTGHLIVFTPRSSSHRSSSTARAKSARPEAAGATPGASPGGSSASPGGSSASPASSVRPPSVGGRLYLFSINGELLREVDTSTLIVALSLNSAGRILVVGDVLGTLSVRRLHSLAELKRISCVGARSQGKSADSAAHSSGSSSSSSSSPPPSAGGSANASAARTSSTSTPSSRKSSSGGRSPTARKRSPHGAIRSIAFSPDDQYIMVGMEDGSLFICTDSEMKRNQLEDALQRVLLQ